MKIIQHSIFWLCVLILLILVFGKSYDSYIESFYFVCLLLPVVIGTAYYFNYYLVPKFLFQQKYGKFILYFIYLIIVSLNLEMYVITAAFIVLAEYQFANMNPITTDVSILTITLYFVVLGLAFVRLIQFYFKDQLALDHLSLEVKKSSLEFLSVVENRQQKQLPLRHIYYIESLSDYVKINSAENHLITTKVKISKLSDQLPDSFIRIHRSYIVNGHFIISYTREHVELKEIKLPISRTYRLKTFDFLETNRIKKS